MAKKTSLKDALGLQPKVEIRKSVIDIEETERAATKMHKTPRAVVEPPPSEPEIVAAPVVEDTRIKRLTIDLSVPMHAAIRMETFRRGITIKDYLLDLARKDLKLPVDMR